MRSHRLAILAALPLALAACGRGAPPPANDAIINLAPSPPEPAPAPPPEPAPPPAAPDNGASPAPAPDRNCGAGGTRVETYMCPGECIRMPGQISCVPTMRTCTRVVANPAPCLNPPAPMPAPAPAVAR